MKKSLVIIIALISIQFSFGQNRYKPSSKNTDRNSKVIIPQNLKTTPNLFLIKKSTISNIHAFHKIEVKNTSKTAKNYTLKTETIACTDHKEHSNINFSFYDISKKNQLKELIVEPGMTKNIYVRATAANNVKIATWNCSNILIHNPITNEKEVTKLVSYIQDPKNVH